MKRRHFLRATSLFPFISIPGISLTFSREERSKRETGSPLQPGQPPEDFFYKPANAWAADFIPLYANGEFQLFFLLDWRDAANHGEGTPWYRISTTDFVHFKEHGEMLSRGTKEQQDLYVFTGSALYANNRYHIFYTGHNDHFGEKGKPIEAVMHAVSNDMKTWQKLPQQIFFAPTDRYEMNDWRDPFVFWNEETGEYNMLTAARFKNGIPRRRGLTALSVSKDLEKWEVKEPFYAPDLYYTHECPDLFKIGDWWYLLFSEFTDRVRTRYRMSRSLKGPWITPAADDFDGHAFYAAKTASDGKNRFLFGWNPTRDGSKDTGSWQWGGNLVVHQIKQQIDGTLSVNVPDTVSAAFQTKQIPGFEKGVGNFKSGRAGWVNIESAGTFAAAVAGKLPDICKIALTLTFGKGTKECGLMFRSSDDLDQAYYIRLEPENHKLVFDKWPRDRSEVTHMTELDRDIVLSAGEPVHLLLFIDGNKGVAYVNNKVAMNFRAYDLPPGNWGVFVTDGNAAFQDISISTS